MSTIAEIRARWEAATRGPWAWRGNKDSHSIDLLSARTAWGDVVMDFRRWGLQDARPCFCTDGLIVRPEWVMGPPHHPGEIVGIDHPDAIAIAAAPADVATLLAELDRLTARLASLVEDEWGGWHFDPDNPEYEWRCGYCHARGNESPDHDAPQHAPDCPIAKARAALAGEAVRL